MDEVNAVNFLILEGIKKRRLKAELLNTPIKVSVKSNKITFGTRELARLS
ncbi:hypothetical protein ABEX39_23635 [Bacillus albus]